MASELNCAGFVCRDIDANHIKGSTAFKYNGHIISMSTVFNPPEVVVFAGDEFDFSKIVHRAESVEAAIRWCDL